MSSKQPSKRNSRKNVVRSFQRHVDLARLDYRRRIKPGRDIAKITGLMFAAVIYMAGFGLAYVSYGRGMIDDVFLSKVAFILMIPATVVGLFAYLITSNRREFPIREDIRAHVRQFEGEHGYLWRFEPILSQLQLKKIDTEWLATCSRENRLVELAPEDICAAVQAIDAALQDNTAAASAAAISQVEDNLDADPDPA